MAASPLPSVGDLVAGKYRIESAIGEGGMGVVLGALDTSLNRPVAIKFLAPARAANEAAAARFQREAQAAASIQSEHVVRIYEVDMLPNGAPFIVMEHLRGSDLAHVIDARGGLPIDEAADFVLQACEALGEAHARGIVHRDLKPQNLFLTQRNDGSACVKVLDFGIASSAEANESSPKLTKTDMVMGTPLYMSPEQVRSLKSVDNRADVWALGAILHELLTASPPFDGPTASALHAAIAMDPPTPLRSRRPDAPEALEAVIARCLEKKPADRYQDVGALASALAPFASERGRTSASRIGNVVRAASTSTTGPSNSGAAPSGDAPTVPQALVLASTMNAGTTAAAPLVEEQKRATDGAWAQKSAATAPPPPVAPSRMRAGVIAAVLLLVGGAALVVTGFMVKSPALPAPAAPAKSEAAPPAPVVVTPAPVASAPPPAESAVEQPVASASAAPSEVRTPHVPRPAPIASSVASQRTEHETRLAEEKRMDTASATIARQEEACRRDLQTMRISSIRPEGVRPAIDTFYRSQCHGALISHCQKDACLRVCEVVGDPICLRQANTP